MCAGPQPPMLFLYIYHIRRRRTWTEEQRGRRTWTWRLCCCCVVSWKRGATAWANGAREMHSTGLYQQNFYGARAICFAWLMLADFLVFFVVNSCLFALPCRGVFALPCWAQNVGRGINEPANPQPPPRVFLPAELNCCGARGMFQFVCKREFVSWACMVDGSHKKRDGGCFLATEIPPCRTPMSPNWVMDVRNRLILPRQFQRTIKRAVSY